MKLHSIIANLFYSKQDNKNPQIIRDHISLGRDTKTYSESDPIEKLEFPIKIEAALKKGKIDTVGKFYKRKRKRLKKIKYIGPKALRYLMKIKREIHLSILSSDEESQTLSLTEKNNNVAKQEPVSQTFSYIDLDSVELSQSISKEDDINILGLPIRLENSLRNVGLYTVGEFYDYDNKALFKVRNIGYKSYNYLLKFKKELETTFNLQFNAKLVGEVDRIDANNNEQKESLEEMLNKAQLAGDDPIETLSLPTRIENSLKNAGIDTVKLLFISTKNEIVESRNLGYKSLELIMKHRDAIEKGIALGIKEEELVDITLNRCGDERAKSIIIKRYGLSTGEKETLEGIGKSLNITRERVRQIQNKALTRMRHPSTKSKQRLKELLAKVFLENGGIITDKEADSLIPELIKDSLIDGSSFLDLVSDIGWIQSNQVGDVLFYSPKFNMFSLASLMTEILQVLTKDRLLLDAKTIAENLSCRNLMDKDKLIILVFRCCKLDPRIDEKIAGKFTAFSRVGTKKTIWISLISQVLAEARIPLHWEAIAQRVNEKLINEGQALDQRRIHFILIDNSEFALSGKKGTYGLIEWGFRKDSTVDLVIESLKKAGSPLSWREIYTHVHKYKDTKPGNILSILNNKNKFIKQAGGYWLKNLD